MKSQSKQSSSQARASGPDAAASSKKLKLKQKQQQQQQQRKPQRPTASTSFPSAGPVTPHQVNPVEIQQAILNVFTQAIPIASQPHVFRKIAQEVKGHLFHRDFSSAFSRPDYLDVYAARWSAARALAYADIFAQPERHTWFQSFKPASDVLDKDNPSESEDDVVVDQLAQSTLAEPASRVQLTSLSSCSDYQPSTTTRAEVQDGQVLASAELQSRVHSRTCLRIACVGGGAGAEVVALAAALRYWHSKSNTEREGGEDDRQSLQSGTAVAAQLHIVAIDVADWSQLIQKLSDAIIIPPALPSYASQSAREKNRALVDVDHDGIRDVSVRFKRSDILQSTLPWLGKTLQNVSIVTIMFTLNELFTTSLPNTTALLLNLTEAMEVGAQLIVVDSPGSYSEIQFGASQGNQGTHDKPPKRYPMKWLLDHTLLEVARIGGGEEGSEQSDDHKSQRARWIKTEDHDSKWFRIDEKLGLKYGIDLENCRYQIHVFRKLR